MKNKTKLLRMAMLCIGMVFYATEMWAADYYMTVKCNPTGAAKVYAKIGYGGYSEGTYSEETVYTYWADGSCTPKIKYDNLAEGYTFLGWSEGAVATSDANIKQNLKDVKPGDESSVTLNYSGSNTVTATYYANFTCVQAVSANTSQGSVSCPYTVALNAEVTLTATAEDGYEFVGWKHGNDADFCSTEASYTFTTNSNNAGIYTAYFEEEAASTDIVAHQAITNGAYWATFYAKSSNYQASEGTEVYAVTLSGTTMTMNKIADGIVKRGQGVVLKNYTTPNFTMTKTEKEATGNFNSNSLKGTPTPIKGNGSIFVLNYGPKGVGFYKLSNNGTLAKNKAYLEYSGANAREFFLFDEATAISAPLVNSEEVNSEVYDLQGRRVNTPTKGLYIVNGKKAVVK